MTEHAWSYHPASGHLTGADLTGYKVEATDGGIGKVAKHSDEVDDSYLVVDTGVWIFGKEVLLPAGTVTRVDPAQRTVHVSRTKDEIKRSPEFHRERHLADADYRQQVGTYYGYSPLGRPLI
ncbi:PRC-barrel domain containing protein [Streptomyces subrutilus]|uniref:PRC-barrel domain containing protein n=1 Tax=Streptomyces subrutilus TaxID=36818 RepID=A0A5P2UF75_9ACTN|nr:PRC-barrel domain containing protein [Streptomyces subrutilus]QEU77590.1 PRC-barrel domain containing protein [Streptomyces subrutilus]WSJ33311.1 PRC-barrel domain containing protein [Streptomyces subrutilus]GGZ64459.1 hypothetical protein GCM10010371_25060 [Streptomyces subrutilus]